MAVSPLPFERRLGAFPLGDGRAEFRVWAPAAERITLRLDGRERSLDHAGFGVHEAIAETLPGGDYAYVVDGAELPDPCSRWQPQGLRGPSRLLDPAGFTWTDHDWTPPAINDLVLYELHVGTFTAEGTFDAVIPHLRDLRELGVTAIELMPVGEFPGRHGWGYDGVYISAAHSAYGGPQALQRLVDAAHAAGLAVILDVVYNHVGASGTAALKAFGPYFTARYETPWGDAINYDAEHSDAVREWALQSAGQWVRDFHVDGLRLDAVHAIKDGNPEHLVAAVVRRTAPAFVIAESGLNDPRVMREPQRGGWGCDAAWADDFHHALRTLLTGDREGYYAEFGAVGDLAKAFHRPHVHDGTYSSFRHRRFGARAEDVPPERFVVFSANHDQVGNRAFGDRLPVETRPLAALCTLLSPFTPMLFQGEEHGRAGAVPVLLGPHRRGHRDRHARGAAARVRRLRRVPRPRGARSTGSGDVRGLQAHAHRRARGPARALRPAPARSAMSCRPATPTRSTTTSTPAGCACGAAASSWSPTSRAARRMSRSTRPPRPSSPPAMSRSNRDTWR